MTHPYFHARSSVRVWGGVPDDYLPVHQWLDASKASCADYRHRALRHHAQGLFDAERALGVTVRNADGREVPVRYVGEQHVLEDCAQRIPTINDWLEYMREGPWLGESPLSSLEHAESLAAGHGGCPDDYLDLVCWLDEHRAHTTRPGFRMFRHHVEGVAAAVRRFGPVLSVADGGVSDTARVAETHIRRSGDGTLCCQADWLRRLRRAPWMACASTVEAIGHMTRRGE